MKVVVRLFLLSLPFYLISCTNKGPVNQVTGISICDSEILIRNWEFTQPLNLDSYVANDIDSNYSHSSISDQGDNIPDYKSFTETYDQTGTNDTLNANTFFKRYPYHSDGSYVEIDSLFHSFSDTHRMCYAAAIINSDKEQDVALLAGANDAIQIWLNKKTILKNLTRDYISGYQYPLKVHLRHGENFVLVKLTSMSNDWRFFLKACSLIYANENSLGANYASFLSNNLIQHHQNLKIKIWSPFIYRKGKISIEMSDFDDKIVLRKIIENGDGQQFSLKSLSQGPYSIKMTTDSAVFRQKIFYGDYKKYFAELKQKMKRVGGDTAFIRNADLLLERFKYLDTVEVVHNNAYERKVAINLYELGDVYNRYMSHNEPFKNIKGLHLRSQLSAEHRADSYMVYVPENYSSRNAIPLVVMMPHETTVRNFNVSTYVADINRIEHISKLADKYGFAVLWSSFKVYSSHSLTNVIPKTVFETVNDVRKNYNIDTTRIYAYGDCAGGELALFTANKYPSYFAAVAVEGPAIPDNFCNNKDSVCHYSSEYDISRDFYNTLENYQNFSTYILHSKHDGKSDIKNSRRLVCMANEFQTCMKLTEISVKKGSDRFYFFINLMPDNSTLTAFFKFYKGKQVRCPDSLSFGTWQLKYNRAFWLTINDKESGKKAYVKSIIDKHTNTLNIISSNVKSLILDISKIRNIDLKRWLQVKVNGNLMFSGKPRCQNITLNLVNTPKSNYKKSNSTEGPLNDFFAHSFLIVRGTTGTAELRKSYELAIDTFKTNWTKNFLNDTCRIKADCEISQDDISKYNLLVIGTEQTNSIYNRIKNMLPARINAKNITLGSNAYEGDDLSMVYIYPNPLNPRRYIIIAAGNAKKYYAGMLNNLMFSGWSDYIINAKGYTLNSGLFNREWN